MSLVCCQGTNGDGVDPVWMAKHAQFAFMWSPTMEETFRNGPAGPQEGPLLLGEVGVRGDGTSAVTERSTLPTNSCGFYMTLSNWNLQLLK